MAIRPHPARGIIDMALSHKTVSVGTSATELHTADGVQNVFVRCPAGLTDNLYIGGSGVTTSDYGLRLSPDETSPMLPLPDGDMIHAITDGSAAIDVQILTINAVV